MTSTTIATATATLQFRPIPANKLIKDGKVAVLLSHSWHCSPNSYRYDPVLIEMILKDAPEEELTKYAHKVGISTHDESWCHLKVQWVPVGTFFRIERCGDNGEFIVTVQNHKWEQA